MIDKVSAMEEIQRRKMYGKRSPTTPYTQDHCDHECVCIRFHEDKYQKKKEECTIPFDCPYDTRSRPSPSPKFTDNGARKALWVSDAAHEYFSKIAKSENKTHASIVDEAVMTLKSQCDKKTPESELCGTIDCKWCESEQCAEVCQTWIEAQRADAAAQAREDVLDALARDFKGRYVEDAVAEIRRFPESLRSTGGEHP